MEIAGLAHEYRFAWRDVAQYRKTERLEWDRSRRDQVFRYTHRLIGADDQRPDAVRIAKRQHSVAGDHRNDRIGATTASMHTCDRLENRIGIEPVMLCGALELERKNIQQNLAVGVR